MQVLMNQQPILNLPFNHPKILMGKREKRITVACSDEFRQVFELVARIQNSNPSELGFRYLLEGLKNDLGNMFMYEPHLDSTLRNILNKKI